MQSKLATLSKERLALLEVCLLFLPAIPAYLWLWPYAHATDQVFPVQSLVYIYLLIGTLVIGLRRWNLYQLGVNWDGFWFSLVCGLVLLAGRTLALLSTNVPLSIPSLSIWQWLEELAFYFLLVGLVEELLFRGLIYRALHDWSGHRRAILGSTLAFGAYHIGGGGLPGLVGGLVIGLIFGAMRWRAGGILGLIIVHAVIDLAVVEFVPGFENRELFQIQVIRPGLAILGWILLISLAIYLWNVPFFHKGKTHGLA